MGRRKEIRICDRKRCFGLKKTDYNDIVATVTNEEKKQLGFTTVSTKAAFQHTQIPIKEHVSPAEDVYMETASELIRELKKMTHLTIIKSIVFHF